MTTAKTSGFTIVELMITIAIITSIAAIAIPAYNGYVREGHFTTMRATLNGLRTVIEDYHLENGNYGSAGNLVGLSAINGRFGWNPGGDLGAYTYTVAVTGTNSYDAWGQFSSTVWLRCENRFGTCCDSESSSSSAPSGSC
jgi:prepilin-type N-terminal cleavage/methylation domain-containing protein